jgi:hypothetical protein
MHTLRKLLIVFIVVVIAAVGGVAVVYRTIPGSDTNLTHFDTIIVLGTPANPDGTASPEQRERTLEGVREFKAGVAPNLILTGGPAHNKYVEAHVMATLAITQGVPLSAVIEEDHAQNTIQNIFYSQLTQPSAAHRTYPRALHASMAHPPRTMAATIHLLAARSALHRRGRIMFQAANAGFSFHTLSSASCMISSAGQPEKTPKGRLPLLSSASTAVSSGLAGL